MCCVNVKDFGAVGDGVTWDSDAIQKAFDAVSNAGGGTVIIPSGTYLVVNLKLRDHLTIHLQTGAKLIGPDKSDYYEVDHSVNPISQTRYLICGRNVQDVVIEGGGVIDGAGENFWESEMISAYPVYRPKPNRPAMLYMIDCSRITLRNFRMENAPAYTVWLLGCEEVAISGITIRNSRKGPNTDALDIDCCRNVRISDCDIVAGDDCIALKSDAHRLNRPDAVCENIVVRNCVFSSTTCAIRIGYEGDAPIRDCIFQGLVCYQCSKAIVIQSLTVAEKIYTEINTGAMIENLIFSDFTLRDVDRAFFFRAGGDPQMDSYKGYIKNITLSNIQGNVRKGSFIGSTDDYYVSGIRLNRIALEHTGDPLQHTGDLPNVWGSVDFPAAMLSTRYVRNLKMTDVELTGAKPFWSVHTNDL